MCAKNTEAASMLKSFNRSQQGRPRIEVDKPELSSTIFEIVYNSAAADNRRRAEFLRNIPTLESSLEFQLWKHLHT